MNDCLTIDFEIIFNEEQLDFEITNYSSLLPYYEGDYEIVPRKINQELNTRNKSLNDNITIDAIHYSEVENPNGGITVVIGYE